jgi:ADP-L-glycero-D-manno-heptose 6-epimerase
VIVVTGGAGFIGSCIVARLNTMGCRDLIIVDHLEQKDSKSKNLQGKVYFRYYDKKDFLDLVRADKISGEISCVIHMGACSSTTLTDARYYRENNFEYSCHLASWALKKGVRFIYASSAATYGDGHLGYKDDIDLIPRLKPLNLYGESKQRFDEWILSEGYLQQVVGLKFFNVFGPNEYHKGDMQSVIAKSYQKVSQEGIIRLFKSYKAEYADGEQKRDFIYVKDTVDVVMYFYQHPQISGIFNVGTGQARSWNDLAKAIFAAVGRPLNIEYIEMPESMRPRYQYFTQADMSNLRRAGYQTPFTSLEAGVASYVEYLKEHRYL